jgi:hypothetical protein
MDIKKRKRKEKDCPKDCTHIFSPTGIKSFWVVTAFPTNNRGGPKKVRVPVTVFECAMCGQEKEYPDFWEHNFELPKIKEPVAAKLRKKKTPRACKVGPA